MIILFWTIVQTNMMSNLVSATTVYRVMVPVAIATGVGNPLAMAFIIAAGANYAFALPSATTSTALVTGSGWVPVGFMFKYGILLIIPIVLLLTFIGYPLAALVFR
jgi:sodium-dependent dicarboxylate transporter 2/3/5